MTLDLSTWLTILSVIVAGTVFILSVKHQIEGTIRDQRRELDEKIHKLELQITEMRGTLMTHDQILKQLQDQVLIHLPIYTL